MINIEELRADIEVGTPGGWNEVNGLIVDDHGHMVVECRSYYFNRIARLPQLEREYLAMREALENAVHVLVHCPDKQDVIAGNLRKALGETQ